MNNIWITWEKQRRSIELAKQLNCTFYELNYSGILRYPKCIINTVNIFLTKRYDILFVQNPSMILAALSCVYKKLFKKILIIDRHTTFMLNRTYKPTLEILLFKTLNTYTISNADLTIVTNKYLVRHVECMGGKAIALPDKLPEIKATKKYEVSSGFNILLISSFGADEPIEEVIKAMRELTDQVTLYISGNNNKLDKNISHNVPSNVVFTGYLSDVNYVNLLFSVDAIMALTTSDYCMLCGCYEAVSAGKPLITSKKEVLQDYFKGSIFIDNTVAEIVASIIEIKSNYEKYQNRIIELKAEIESDWNIKYNNLLTQINYIR
jgi:glycosyltransferase involved in cell wall biosynthesis